MGGKSWMFKTQVFNIQLLPPIDWEGGGIPHPKKTRVVLI